MKTCSHCNAEYDGRFCPQCGKGETETAKFCSHCGAAVDASAEFCSSCGKKLHGTPEPQAHIEPAVEKLLHRLYFLPSLLFIAFALLLQIFYKLPAAHVQALGVRGEGGNIYWLCGMKEFDSSAPLLWAKIAIVLAVVLAIIFLRKTLCKKPITVVGKKNSLGSVISLLLPLAYLPYIIIGFRLIGFINRFKIELMGSEIAGYKIDAAIPLILVFSILFLLVTLGLSLFLFGCERGTFGMKWHTTFYRECSPEQLELEKEHKKIRRMMVYARFPWLRAFALLMLFSGVFWLVRCVFAYDIIPGPFSASELRWAHDLSPTLCTAYIQYENPEFLFILFNLVALPISSLGTLVSSLLGPFFRFIGTESLSYYYNNFYRQSVENYIQWFAFLMLILWFLKKFFIQTTHFAPQVAPKARIQKLLFALLGFWNFIDFFSLYCLPYSISGGLEIADVFELLAYMANSRGRYGLPILIFGVLLLLLPIFIGKRVFRKAAQYRDYLSHYFYGEDTAQDAKPKFTIEDLEKAAKGEAPLPSQGDKKEETQ